MKDYEFSKMLFENWTETTKNTIIDFFDQNKSLVMKTNYISKNIEYALEVLIANTVNHLYKINDGNVDPNTILLSIFTVSLLMTKDLIPDKINIDVENFVSKIH